MSRATRINDMVARWKTQLAGVSTNTPEQLIDVLAANPFITTSGAARQLSVAFTTAQRAIDHLERKGIVQLTTEARRNRVYCARPLLDILEEPAQLKPLAK